MVISHGSSEARPTSVDSTNNLAAKYGWKNTNEAGYTINEVPSGTLRSVKIICLGAGASGINLAKLVQDQMQNVELQIYDKNADVGGTWLENRYPGCACDIPSASYQFTWEPHIWSQYYSESPEIFDYFKGIVVKYGLEKYIKLRHRVDHAEWDDDEGQWHITLTDLDSGNQFTESCDIFINAGGPLNYWEWPKIPGLNVFKGVLAHSAAYPEGLDLNGKRVAVVGIGSSGVQIIAKIQSQVEKLYTWISTPTWMTPSFASKYSGPGGLNFKYSEEQKKRFREEPDYYLKYCKMVETQLQEGFLAFHHNTPEAKALEKMARQEMMEKLKGRDDLIEKLIPKDFPVGCKRPTPGNGFLEALVSPNVTTFTKALEKITEQGFLDPEGNEHEVDVIILATGFNTTWVPRFPIIANGYNLQDQYRKNPISYLGLSAPFMPNYFTFYGPYGPLGQGSALCMIEKMADYFAQMIKKLQLENIKSYTPKMQVALDYQEHTDLYHNRTVWSGNCRSWFKGGKLGGKIMLHPGTRTQYMELIATPRYEDYEIQYRNRNVWYWLGNGFSTRDLDGRDLTWYLGLVDGKDEQQYFDV
ncbi:hypothetical protein AYL99_07494 [Fonsecaea erecta]|uniref:Sterigmatocystin biosynthesis monooxygenase stcW n=1 Tax=Fonsecaea erecta TaxID=1367422 RepID=A0A178ZF39_9EURO|nr:hypothetical protein AYL99_07494 [Fonsecaea erecta]OAP58404.1 hypothetical protein AYL99_07494 [Fonsecaea erecta]